MTDINIDLNTIDLGIGTSSPQNEKHIESKIQADTLFTFCKKLDYIIADIEAQRLCPRYVREDISYLQIKDINVVAIPMKCFCDINLHRLINHIGTYGSYGLAFSKEWGMNKGIQPIQYINPKSPLCYDFRESIIHAIDLLRNGNNPENMANNYMLHQLMYYKPYQGNNKPISESPNNDKTCFADECEWRYVPKVSKYDLPPILYDNNLVFNEKLFEMLNGTIADIKDVSLSFTFSELKHIIIEEESDLMILVDTINRLNVNDRVKYELISKIIIWNKSKGDF